MGNGKKGGKTLILRLLSFLCCYWMKNITDSTEELFPFHANLLVGFHAMTVLYRYVY